MLLQMQYAYGPSIEGGGALYLYLQKSSCRGIDSVGVGHYLWGAGLMPGKLGHERSARLQWEEAPHASTCKIR